MKISLIFTLLTISITASFSQKSYYRGFYIDNEGEKREGLIKHTIAKKWIEVYLKGDSVKGFNEFFYKKDKKSDRVKLSSLDASIIVVEYDTFERHSIPRHFDFGGKRMAFDFFEALSKGTINLYLHHHPAYHQANGIGSDYNKGNWTEYTYILEKGNQKVQIKKDDFIQRLFIDKWIKPLIGDDEEIYDKWINKTYRFSDLPQMIEDYNNRAKGMPVSGEVVILRRKDKFEDEFTIQQNEMDIGKLRSNSLISIKVEDIYNIQICIKNGRCGSFSGSSKTKTYIELYQLDENGQWYFRMLPDEEGSFYAQRIEFLMQKREKKNK